MAVKVRPLHDWIWVRLEPLPEVSPGGIILKGTSADVRQRTGVVLAVGPGRRKWSSVLKKELIEPVGVVVGDRVVFYRENLEHQQGKAIVGVLQEIEENTGLIRSWDVLWKEEPHDRSQ
jgi:co-chaperonin GroES (HSP10)